MSAGGSGWQVRPPAAPARTESAHARKAQAGQLRQRRRESLMLFLKIGFKPKPVWEPYVEAFRRDSGAVDDNEPSTVDREGLDVRKPSSPESVTSSRQSDGESSRCRDTNSTASPSRSHNRR